MKNVKWIKYEVIPKGKWIRTRDGYIQHRISESYTVIDVIVADTPQGLVQEGDLVEHRKYSNGEIERVTEIDNLLGSIETENDILYLYDIIAIYTPNKDKTQYTLQWRSKE